MAKHKENPTLKHLVDSQSEVDISDYVKFIDEVSKRYLKQK